MTTVNRLIFALIVVSLPAVSLYAQTKCLSPDEVQKMVAQVTAGTVAAPNRKLEDELVKLALKSEKRLYDFVESNKADLQKRNDEARQNDNVRICEILHEFGWPSSAVAGNDGVAATVYLVRNSRQLDLQVDLLPVIIAAVKKGEIEKAAFARLVDRMRVDAGMKQLFGTQVKATNGFLILAPIEAEAQVDDRRKQFGLPPLAENLRQLERQYRTPLIKAVAPSQPADPAAKSLDRAALNELAGATIDEDDVVRVDTNLVNLNVSVFNNKLKSFVGMLGKDDFKVLENGHEESIEYFGTTEVPFDLVLLLDLSGSTSDKRGLIRKSTQRFIEAARPTDRIAIVAFAYTTEVVCPLTADRSLLLDRAGKIDGSGGTMFWDALKNTIDKVLGPKTPGRRRAVVMMTDGVDNSLGGGDSGSVISFADLIEIVRKSDELIIPIYLDTEGSNSYSDFTKKMYENARRTLMLLAQESGGLYYKARRIEDLNGVYEQVINDLGKVYSLGYKPTNEKRDGSWRRVEIQVPTRPDVTARARPGYYAN
jgi:VWFA-related protein